MSSVIQDISLAKRAGKLILGFDVVKQSLQSGSCHLIITASDLSDKTKKEVNFLEEKFKVQQITIQNTLDELWYILGKRVGVMSVSDKAFSEKIINDYCENATI